MRSKKDKTISNNALLKAAPKTLSRNLEGEEVLLNLDSGIYFGLDKVGTSIWQYLKRGASIPSLCETLLEEYDVPRETAERDILNLVKNLRKNGLIQIEEN